MRYFSYDPDFGMEFYDTAEAAKLATESNLAQYDGADGWPENMEDICWGEVKQSVSMTNRRNAETGSDFDYLCDYELSDEEGLSALVPSNLSDQVAGVCRSAVTCCWP